MALESGSNGFSGDTAKASPLRKVAGFAVGGNSSVVALIGSLSRTGNPDAVIQSIAH